MHMHVGLSQLKVPSDPDSVGFVGNGEVAGPKQSGPTRLSVAGLQEVANLCTHVFGTCRTSAINLGGSASVDAAKQAPPCGGSVFSFTRIVCRTD